MESLYLLIPIAGVFLIVAVVLFLWSVRSGQFDDLNTEGKRILFDDTTTPPHKISTSKTETVIKHKEAQEMNN